MLDVAVIPAAPNISPNIREPKVKDLRPKPVMPRLIAHPPRVFAKARPAPLNGFTINSIINGTLAAVVVPAL